MRETTATVFVHLYGASRYHCDQEGDSATIMVGNGNISISASQEDFLQLAKVCREAAKRIALKTFTKAQEKYDRELAEEFPEEQDSATIMVGNGNISISASQEDFLQLAKVCREAAKRIALKTFTKAQEKYDRELAEEFPEEQDDAKP